MTLGRPAETHTVPFARVFADGESTAAQPGDRFIYDRKNGTLLIHRADADIHFASELGLRQHCFVGRAWTRELTQASAELYARLGGLRGQVRLVEGSLSTLITFEVLG